MEFPIDVRKDKNGNWFYTKGNIRRYFPISKLLNCPILPVKIWQKYNYYNTNFALILPNNSEIFYQRSIYPKDAIKLEYPENTEFTWNTYNNKKGQDVSTEFQLWELYGTLHYTKENQLKPSPEYCEVYGHIFKEMDEYWIMDSSYDLHRISMYIPPSFLTVVSWIYYLEYAEENSAPIFAELNEYFQLNFLEKDINQKGDYHADSFGDFNDS